MKVELDARTVLKHFEANGILPADGLLLRINANIQVVRKQIIVDAVWTVGAAQNVRARRSGWRRRRCGCCRGLRSRRSGSLGTRLSRNACSYKNEKNSVLREAFAETRA